MYRILLTKVTILAIAFPMVVLSHANADPPSAAAWGLNQDGRLGDGTTMERHTPAQVQNLSGVKVFAAGAGHSLALKDDGTVWAWGLNSHGQLGDGTVAERHTPVQVGTPPLHDVAAIAGGENWSLALKSDGTLWAWGENAIGQLGDGTTIERHTPVQVGMPHLSDVIAIAAHSGGGHNLALRSCGIVQAWGWNINGQLGDGTTTDRPFPVQVENLNGTTAIAAGTRHSVAIGTVVAPLTQLTVLKILEHPDVHHLRLFNILIDGSVVATNMNSGSTGPQTVTPGNHTVSETGGTNTHLVQFGTVIGGDCAANGTVSVALGESKTCVITNFDHFGGCSFNTQCCEEGDGTQQCQKCLSTCP